MSKKYCPRCQTTLASDCFYVNRRGVLSGYCKDCTRSYMRDQYKPSPRTWYRVHPHHCRACGETKTEADFYYSSGNRSSYCKACTSIRNAEYRRLHPRRKTNHAIEYRSQKLMAFARKLKS